VNVCMRMYVCVCVCGVRKSARVCEHVCVRVCVCVCVRVCGVCAQDHSCVCVYVCAHVVSQVDFARRREPGENKSWALKRTLKSL
jgi:hypothetical protein